MYIKSIVIDGFKSYGQRTEINGFDPQFNAITGLNGSGKSNILDAICFLLGITNLSNIRATNLQELVYKNGQAGVTKATVSVTFNNRDKKQSPLGYDQYDEIVITRQVVIGGKNKYLINGTNIQNNRVQDLFRSVQLNINNPHFLIMQGRITKVLNMKPPEVLSMIEEAAGTRMYESKKQQAEKTIEKKDAKLKEIDNILTEEINPTLAKLKQERNTYLEYQKIQRELEHLTKLDVAYKFLSAEQMNSKLQEDLEGVYKKNEELKAAITAGQENILAIENRIAELQRQRDEELGGRLEELEENLKEKEKSSLKTDSTLKNIKDSKRQEEKKMAQIQRGMNTDKKALAEKQKMSDELKDMFEELKSEDQRASEALKAAQARFEAISLGKFADKDGGEATTLQEQIISTKAEISAASTEIKTADMKLKHNRKMLEKIQAEMRKTEDEYKRDSKNLSKCEADVEKAQSALNKLGYREGSLEELAERQRTVKHEVNAMKSQINGMTAKYPWLEFNYRDPEPKFDRSLVKGVAATLFKVKDTKFCPALDAVAGGKLGNVIVDTAVAAGKILKNGELARRVVMLPLDKIKAQIISSETLKKAQSLVGKENVFRAIDLITYENKLSVAMEFIFGNAFVVKDLDIANKIAYNPQIQRTCITLDGDKVQPSGDMSGGAPAKGGSTLAHIHTLNEANKTLRQKKKELQEIEAEYQSICESSKQYAVLKNQFDQKDHELKMIRQRLEQTTHHQLGQEVQELRTQCQEMKKKIEEAKIIEAEGTKKIKDLEYKTKNAKTIKEKELKEAEEEVKKCKKAESLAKAKWSEREADEASLTLEISELKKSIESASEQIKLTEGVIKGFDDEILKLEDSLKTMREEVKAAKEAVKAQKETLNANNKEINAEELKKENIKKANNERELELQTLKHKAAKAKEDAKEAEGTVKAMLSKYEWISDDRQFFGQPNTAYDFGTTDPKEAGRRIAKLKEMKEKLSKTVNMRAMKMLGKAEEQFNDLMRKKVTVETDKAKIYKVMEELDIKKKAELRKAWETVNKDFGSIFSSLLPGANAKLEPPEGQDVLDGLEVKVSFGDVWKESLAELSGGQRSLVALSLILSLLLFKPAPLYILDEVDAALDLSHTQNIGNIIKTHFKHSQFIVVSLKDGMFNNANVLFRTKFVDGMSTVTRTAQIQRK